MTREQPTIAIIGAGIAGLAAAYELSEAGYAVTIYEAAPEVGGLAAGFRAPHWDWSLEKFYHHWFASDRHMLGLIERLGWSQDVLFPRPYTVVYYEGKFYPLDSYVEAFKFTLGKFGPVDLLRFGTTGLYLRFTANWQALEKVTADEWMRARVGERIYRALWRPLLVGKFGEENLGVVNMAWLWARIHARTTRLGTFTGGFQAFLDRFAAVLQERRVTIHLDTPVTAIRPIYDDPNATLEVETAHGTQAFRAVLSTSSPALMARLAPDLPDDYTAGLRALQSMGAVVLVVTLDRQLTQYYWHSLPKEAGFPYLAMVEHTNFIGPEHYGGDHILYLGDYLPADHAYFQMSKEELLARFLPSLKRFNPDFDPSWVRASWLWRAAYAQPVPPVNHSQHIPAIRTPVSGLYFASMSQVYPWDRGTNFAVEIGQKAAAMIVDDLKTSDL